MIDIDQFIHSLSLLTFMAILIEAVTEILKNAFPVLKDRSTYILSILIGISLSLAFQVNPFGLDGSGYYVSAVLAGILTSRGANYLNGFVKKLNTSSKQ
ncbi:hypothetical protein P4V43_21780 [Brevibacillus fortis]|uniref:hypothetical protein n=1 Tax=Brevibacillus fortis TaxID=2126352 RepID=UPI002E1FF679|nr:hypothetical protein [Brevibacillus fortis]